MEKPCLPRVPSPKCCLHVSPECRKLPPAALFVRSFQTPDVLWIMVPMSRRGNDAAQRAEGMCPPSHSEEVVKPRRSQDHPKLVAWKGPRSLPLPGLGFWTTNRNCASSTRAWS